MDLIGPNPESFRLPTRQAAAGSPRHDPHTPSRSHAPDRPHRYVFHSVNHLNALLKDNLRIAG